MLDKKNKGGKKGEKHSYNISKQEADSAVGADFMSVRSPERANVVHLMVLRWYENNLDVDSWSLNKNVLYIILNRGSYFSLQSIKMSVHATFETQHRQCFFLFTRMRTEKVN